VTYDGSNRKQVRAKEKESALAEANRIAYSRRIMSDQPGREWMHALLERCNVFHTPFVIASPNATAFNCGTQNVGLALFADVVAHSPTEYVLMMQEANVKELLNVGRNSDNRSARAGQLTGSQDIGRDVDRSEQAAGEYDPYGPEGDRDAD
jgi:hypothetical protein